MSSRMPSLLLKHCQQGRMEALGRVGSKDFQEAGTWPQYDPEESNAGPPGAAAAPQPWVLLLYFLGRLLGSQGKRSLRGARGSAEGDAGTWAQLFPQVQKCFQVWWSGAALCVLPVWGPKRGLQIWEGFQRNIQLCAADTTGLQGSTPERRARFYPTAPG